jgi:hypothetical protein
MSHRKQRALVSLSSASISLILVILYVASCGEPLQDLIQSIGECPSPLDDGNPCTDDTCQDGAIRHAPLPDGELCKFNKNGGQCEQGVCKLSCLSVPSGCVCDDTTDCPIATDCMVEWRCERNLCMEIGDSPVDSGSQKTGDCEQLVVTPDGKMKACRDDKDRPTAMDACKRGICTDVGKGEEVIAEGEPCENGVNGVCTSAGECVRCIAATNAGCMPGQVCYDTGAVPNVVQCSTCPDGLRNGDETDLDCGGHCPKKCGAGQGCKLASDCSDPSLGCAAEVCCQSADCTEPCQGCKAGSGACVALPLGASDKRCAPDQVCNGTAACVKLLHAGEGCTNGSDCINGLCLGPTGSKTCAKSSAGAACIDTKDCANTLMCNDLTHQCG